MTKITANNNNMLKFSSTVVYGQLISHPAFSIDIFLAIMFGAIQCVLIYEIINLELRTIMARADSVSRMKMKLSFEDVPRVKCRNIATNTNYDPVPLQTRAAYQKKLKETRSNVQCYAALLKPVPKIHHKIRSKNRQEMKLMPKSISNLKFSGDRLKYLLSVTPSEYVRRDREWIQNKQDKLISCIETLADDLEQAVSQETLDTKNLFKNALQKSINSLRSNFVSQLNSTYRLDSFASSNFPPLLERYESSFKNSLSNNDLIMSICHTSNSSRSCGDNSNEEIMEIISSTLSYKSSESLIEVLRKRSREFFVNFNYK